MLELACPQTFSFLRLFERLLLKSPQTKICDSQFFNLYQTSYVIIKENSQENCVTQRKAFMTGVLTKYRFVYISLAKLIGHSVWYTRSSVSVPSHGNRIQHATKDSASPNKMAAKNSQIIIQFFFFSPGNYRVLGIH